MLLAGGRPSVVRLLCAVSASRPSSVLSRVGSGCRCVHALSTSSTLASSMSSASILSRPSMSYYSTGSSSSSNGTVVQFRLADIGEGITECELIQWFVKEGDTVEQFQRLCEVQSDKATVEITSRYDGIIRTLHHKPGDIAKVGAPLVDIHTQPSETPSDNKSNHTTETPSDTTTAKTVSNALTTNHADTQSDVLATPAVRRVAKENNVDLARVKGTGKAGRILKEDVLNFLQNGTSQPTAPQSTPAAAAAGSTATASQEPKVVPLTPVQKAMVKSMQLSLSIPHFGFSHEMRFDAFAAIRQQINKALAAQPVGDLSKITFMPLLLKSYSLALNRYPLLNAQFVETNDKQPAHLLYRPQHNIAIAIDSPAGLVVPVMQRVNEKSILDIAADLATLQSQAKRGALPPEAFRHATTTISNIGNVGGRVLHPVIPHGTVCIAAIGKAQTLPRFNDQQELEAHTITTVSFSADHRVVDGATVANFFDTWRRYVENPGLLMMHLK